MPPAQTDACLQPGPLCWWDVAPMPIEVPKPFKRHGLGVTVIEHKVVRTGQSVELETNYGAFPGNKSAS